MWVLSCGGWWMMPCSWWWFWPAVEGDMLWELCRGAGQAADAWGVCCPAAP